MSISYGSSGDIRRILGNPEEAEVSANDITLGRQKATALVDSYLEAQFSANVPWTASGDVPVLINSITDDLACYYIKRDLHPGPIPLTEEVKEEYWDKPVGLLEKIKDRELRLPELTASIAEDTIASREDIVPVFDMDAVENQRVDPELLDDIADEK